MWVAKTDHETQGVQGEGAGASAQPNDQEVGRAGEEELVTSPLASRCARVHVVVVACLPHSYVWHMMSRPCYPVSSPLNEHYLHLVVTQL